MPTGFKLIRHFKLYKLYNFHAVESIFMEVLNLKTSNTKVVIDLFQSNESNIRFANGVKQSFISQQMKPSSFMHKIKSETSNNKPKAQK